MVSKPILPNVASGEPDAVANCLSRYGNLVWSLARRSCRDEQSAEDAVQEIFMKIWKVADRFDPQIASESTFVAMIARRHLIDINRKKKSHHSNHEEFTEATSAELGPAARYELNDEAAQAAKILESLPDDQRKVIKLSVYNGLSQSRIAEATGLSLGTVKTHIRRGLIKLRAALFSDSEHLQDLRDAHTTLTDGEAS